MSVYSVSSSSEASTSGSSSYASDQSHSQSQQPSQMLSILQPLGYTKGPCGYCQGKKLSGNTHTTEPPKKTSSSYGCWAHLLSCSTYRLMLDRGWRRSGKYCYKPDMRSTCCPQYTISLDAAAFVPGKSQRQVLNRFAALVIDGDHQGKLGWGPVDPSTTSNLDPSLNTSSSSASVPPAAMLSTSPPTNKNVATKADSLLTTAKSVMFNPPVEPPTIRDEDQEHPVPTRSKLDANRKGKAQADEAMSDTVSTEDRKATPKPSSPLKGGKRKAPTDLSEMVHQLEWANSPADKPFKHKFEYVLEEASFTEEKYALFQRYQVREAFERQCSTFYVQAHRRCLTAQTQVHHEPDSKVTRKGFRRFLVDTPLHLEPTPNPSYNYGSHHGLYLFDGQLIALAVIDILPGAVSSVYFAWDPQFSSLSLGKVSALREIALVRELQSQGGLEDLTRYMMGYYIHSCTKMKYKADYQPSWLLDPMTNDWYAWDTCKKILDGCERASFSEGGPLIPQSSSTSVSQGGPSGPSTPGNSAQQMDVDEVEAGDEEEEDTYIYPTPSPPGCLDPSSLPKRLLLDSIVLEGRTVFPLLFSAAWHDPSTQREVKELLATTGEPLVGKIAIYTTG
ncbi:BQ2448_88 [Microbotryum intermedium]|uniref:arginyltransferase n=1 Tax=Microbotryum intermedium TaxID=269621 RepID=A0A238F4J2_9BASI|nr:BQ2448_88 [Microbotryum intermedium]